MPRNFRTHDDNRKVLCVVCLQKRKGARLLNERYKKLVKTFCSFEYNETNEIFPTSICGTCRLALSEFSKENYTRSLDEFDYSSISLKRKTRNTAAEEKCECHICLVARTNINVPNKNPEPSQEDDLMTVCKRCLSVIGVGISHECNKKYRADIVMALASKSSPHCSEKIVKSCSKKRDEELMCEPGPSGVKKELFSTNALFSIQKNLNLSGRKTLEMAKELRTASGSRFVIERGANQKLSQAEEHLNTFFNVQKLQFVESEKDTEKKVERWCVMCNDVHGLIYYAAEKRRLDINKLRVRIGIDGGGGFLKICINIFSEDVISDDKFLNTGVKKLFLLCIVPEVKEIYLNIKELWIKTGLHQLNIPYTLAADLKLTNLILGLGSHSSSYPCCWCESHKNQLDKKGNQRTFKSLKDSFWEYYNCGDTEDINCKSLVK